MEGEDNPWTLESPMRISKMKNRNFSITTSMDTWKRNVGQRRKRGKQENVSNVMKKDILPRIAKGMNQ